MAVGCCTEKQGEPHCRCRGPVRPPPQMSEPTRKLTGFLTLITNARRFPTMTEDSMETPTEIASPFSPFFHPEDGPIELMPEDDTNTVPTSPEEPENETTPGFFA